MTRYSIHILANGPWTERSIIGGYTYAHEAAIRLLDEGMVERVIIWSHRLQYPIEVYSNLSDDCPREKLMDLQGTWYIRYTNFLTGTPEVSRPFRSKETAERELSKRVYKRRNAQLVFGTYLKLK